MGIGSLAILAYVSSSQERREELAGPLVRFMTDKRYSAFLIADGRRPSGARGRERLRPDESPSASLFSRTVHPASPTEITVHDKQIDLDAGENPFLELEASNPDEFRKHVENGRQVYYQNCVFCHGDNMDGNGMFVHGLDPIPTNFADHTIATVRDTFLFWRISKGGPGLPEEGGPWDTAMPAWEKFLKEDEIWDVILFLYDFTGQKPRAGEEAARNDLPPDLVCAAPRAMSRCPGRLVVFRADGPDAVAARAGSRRRDRRAAGVGQDPLCEVLFAMPRREG